MTGQDNNEAITAAYRVKSGMAREQQQQQQQRI
jgi:hypothetical protein